MPPFKGSILASGRVYPQTKPISQRTTPLSLLDATVTDFAKTCGIWLFEPPEQPFDKLNLTDHLSQALRITLDAYPQWSGQLKSVTSLKCPPIAEWDKLSPHAQRFGRVYVTYGSSGDPGVELIVANSTATLEGLSPLSRIKDKPIWDRHEVPFNDFVPSTLLANPLKDTPEGDSLPAIAIQITTLACGGYVLSVRIAHALADAHSLVYFVKHWAAISRSIVKDLPIPLQKPVFDAEMVDSLAAGDINVDTADNIIVRQTQRLPFNRYDWWIPSPGTPSWGALKPDAFVDEVIPAGQTMPWHEVDADAPVSHYAVHLNKQQVDFLWREANTRSPVEGEEKMRISQHDAILAHIWSCINRARMLDQDDGPVHADVSYGLRPVLNLGVEFMGSPMVILNLEMSARELIATTTTEIAKPTNNLNTVAQHIRKTITKANNPTLLRAHLHSVAFEKSPQRIWQAFLGRRHIVVTTWARAGLYEVDFGFGGGSKVRYAEGVVPDMDGIVLIKEAGPVERGNPWTENGVDVSIRLRTEDMERLMRDPLLLPDI